MSHRKQQSKRFRRNKLVYKKRRKYNFRNSMNEDYFGSAAIRTKYEYLLESFLREAGLPFFVNQVFCFKCNKFFPYEHRDIPEHCYYCEINFKRSSNGDKGHLSRPDFILNLNEENTPTDYKKIGIIRVDGAVHREKKATRISDYWILQSFKERGIKVFIIENEVLLKKTVAELRDLCNEIKLMMEDEDLYTKYTESKSYQELVFCPDIELRRMRRR